MNGEQTMEDKIAGIPARASQWKHLHGILRGEKP